MARQRPDVALFLPGGNVRRTGLGCGAIAVRQPLNQVRELVADGLVSDLAHFQPNNKPRDFALTVNDGGAAEMFARHPDRDRLSDQVPENVPTIRRSCARLDG